MNAEVLSGTVLGSCTLQKVIGRGGMGAVFLAQQSRPRRQVAVKVLLPISKLQPNQQAAFLERFRRETDAAASLDHPNILPVHECGESNGLAYLVMPYVSGGTLRDELEKEGKLPLTRIVSYLDQIAAALDFAHERGIIHRDIKPANLLMTPEKRLMLTDFGLVKIVTGGQPTKNPLSESGMPIGTPDYMAPEQVLGGEIDARADIYALGIILYQMVTGTVPFKGEMPMKVALQHLNTLPPQPRSLRPDLPPQAEQVLLRALAKRATDRYMFAHDLANAFRQALEAAGVQVGDRINGLANNDDTTGNRPRGLFDPVWQGSTTTSQGANNHFSAAELPDSMPTARAMNDMTTRASNLTDTSPLTNAHPTATRLAKKLLVAHSERKKTTKDAQSVVQQPISPAPTQNGQQRPFLPTTNTPVPPTQETNNGLSPQYLRLGQKTNQYNLQPQIAHQTERATNEVPQPFQFSPLAPLDSQTYNLNGETRPVQSVQTDSVTAPVQAIQTKTGGQFGVTPTTFDNKKNDLSAKQSDTTPLISGNGQNEPKGLVTKQLENTALVPTSDQQTRVTRQLGPVTGMLGGATATTQHPVGEYSGDTGMLRLHQPVKVVKVPIAGQPGQYMTGILQVTPQMRTRTGVLPPPTPAPTQPEITTLQGKVKRYSKLIILVGAILVVIFASSIYELTRPAPITYVAIKSSVKTATNNNPDATATAGVYATATVEETNLILDDPLSENIHDWRQGNYPGGLHYEFKNGAYHIRNDGDHTILAALLNLSLPAKYSYSLNMQQITGDQNSPFNFFGLMLRYSEDKKGIPEFYFFSIINNKNQSKYQFRRFDGHQAGPGQNPWVATLFDHNAGDELHKGTQPNTVKIMVDGNHFTFMVNSKQVGDAHDDVYKETGALGMGANQKGNEMAFTNFRLVRLL